MTPLYSKVHLHEENKPRNCSTLSTEASLVESMETDAPADLMETDTNEEDAPKGDVMDVDQPPISPTESEMDCSYDYQVATKGTFDNNDITTITGQTAAAYSSFKASEESLRATQWGTYNFRIKRNGLNSANLKPQDISFLRKHLKKRVWLTETPEKQRQVGPKHVNGRYRITKHHKKKTSQLAALKEQRELRIASEATQTYSLPMRARRASNSIPGAVSTAFPADMFFSLPMRKKAALEISNGDQ